jgi:hypothetical protein
MADVELVDALDELGVPATKTIAVSTNHTTPTNITLEDAGVFVVVVNVTTDGSGLAQTINLPEPVKDGNGYNGPYVNHFYIIRAQALTDPSDSIQVTQDGSPQINQYNPTLTNFFAPQFSSVVLDFESAAIALRWCYDGWYVDTASTDFAFSDTAQGSAVVKAFNGGADIDGGDVILQPGTIGSGSSRAGLVIVNGSLPTSDPAVVDALWQDVITHVVKVSQG